MKKKICVVGLVLLFGLFASGCADQQPQEKTTQEIDHEDTETDIPVGTETPHQDEANENDYAESNVTSVTQEELDKLKEDIGKLEADDLGGLSGD
ncbi:MAG: hypothetical protein JXA98_09260 [Methanosarcinaceae archaeon]|nr:hypothetical protein [Methanosarcinaceae archaeon]